MLEPALVTRLADLPRDFRLADLPPRAAETGVLMADPGAFEVAYVINPHMADGAGKPNRVDRHLAREQWGDLAEAFVAAGLDLQVIPAVPGLPDLVFTANQSLAFTDAGGRPKALLSRMRAPERRAEVAVVAAWHEARGLETVVPELAAGDSLEGAGDLLLVPGRRLCLAGVGPRTSGRALAVLPEILGMPLVQLELAGDFFYHLDTCVCPLDDRRVLAHLPALTPASRELLAGLYELILAPAPEEAERGLACNAVVLPEGVLLVEESCRKTRAVLELQGFEVRPLPTSEFLKSGGSLFCMKLMVP